MKKYIIIFVVLVAGAAATLFLFYGPKSFSVFQSAPEKQVGIIINYPESSDEISSPIKITGYVNGDGWAGFEGQVGTVKLLDVDGNIISSGILTATTPWTQLPTSFEADLSFKIPKNKIGTLVFKNENPSGLPEKDKESQLIVNFKQ